MTDTGEILKSGLVDKAADLLHKLAGPMAEEFGAMLGDKVRVYRVKNLVATMQKTERILRDAGLPPNAVPPRLLLPIVENSSVEDRESLQEMWAGLLATASQQTDSVSPSFIETLKQLTPDEARHFERIFPPNQKHRISEPYITSYAFTDRWDAPLGAGDTFERLGLIRREYDVDLRWKKADSLEEALDKVDTELGYLFVFTRYAVSFLEACRGPRPKPAENDSPNPADGR